MLLNEWQLTHWILQCKWISHLQLSTWFVACHGRAVKTNGFKLWCFTGRVWSRNPVGHLLRKIGEVVLSALPARLRIDDTQAYIHMDCKRGNPVSALGVGGNDLWKIKFVAHTLKWPSGLVCLAMGIQIQKTYRLPFTLVPLPFQKLSIQACTFESWKSVCSLIAIRQ